MREATSSVEKQLADARQSVDGAMEEAKPAADPIALTDGLADRCRPAAD